MMYMVLMEGVYKMFFLNRKVHENVRCSKSVCGVRCYTLIEKTDLFSQKYRKSLHRSPAI